MGGVMRKSIKEPDLKYLKIDRIYCYGSITFKLMLIGPDYLKGEIVELSSSDPTVYKIGDQILLEKRNIDIALSYANDKEQTEINARKYATQEEIENSKRGWCYE